MMVYLPRPLTQKPVLAGFLKGGSEDTLSVFTGSDFHRIRRAPRAPACCHGRFGFSGELVLAALTTLKSANL
jgi:hypothetical protein